MIRFDPPGQMSAGMSCEMMVTFKPMVSILNGMYTLETNGNKTKIELEAYNSV